MLAMPAILKYEHRSIFRFVKLRTDVHVHVLPQLLIYRKIMLIPPLLFLKMPSMQPEPQRQGPNVTKSPSSMIYNYET